MPPTADIVQVPPNSTGNKIDCVSLTVGANTVDRQCVVLVDPNTASNYSAVNAAGALIVQPSPQLGVFSSATAALTTSGDNSIVAAVTGFRIKVYSFDIQNQSSTTAVTVYWESASSALTGTVILNPLGSWSKQGLTYPQFYFGTAASAALRINLSASVNVSVSVSYWSNDAS